MDCFWSIVHLLIDRPLCVLALLVLILFYRYLVHDFGMFNKYGITGPKPYPVVGTAWSLFKKPMWEYDLDLLSRYKDKRVCSVFEFGFPGLVILDWKLAKEILIKEFSLFINRKRVREAEPPLDRALVSIRDDHWRHVRSKVSPIFSGSKLKHMTPLIQKSANSLISILKKYAESGESVDAKHVFSMFTMDTIASTMFGLDVDTLNNPDHPFVEKALSLSNMTTWRRKLFTAFMIVCPPLFRLLVRLGFSFLERETLEYFNKHLRRTLTERRESGEDFRDFIDLMIHVEVSDDDQDRTTPCGLKWSSKGLTQIDIVAQMFVFFLGGFETTSNTFILVAYNMMIYEDMQAKMQAEVDEMLNGEEPDYENIHKLQYMDMFINEVSRLYGQAPRTLREANQDVEVDGVFIPKGTAVWIPIAALHRDPEMWPDPNTFDPERFSPEQKTDRAYLPFGIGPRNCVAKRLAELELRLGLAKILQKCTLILDEAQSPREIKLAKLRATPEKLLKFKVVMR